MIGPPSGDSSGDVRVNHPGPGIHRCVPLVSLDSCVARSAVPSHAPAPPAASTAARARPLAIPPEAITGVLPAKSRTVAIGGSCGERREHDRMLDAKQLRKARLQHGLTS